ncbi:hypothetical protein SAMN05216331_14232 [Porphyromonadaceae bacterium KH3R12]|nr:hypothetical protein SAMN05216331_14232 [Porphyromonadaceae bacterium KH3R12]
MKTITLTVFTLLFAVSLVSAQEFRGKLNIKGVSQSSSIKYSEPVKLFKDFKDNKYQIVFTLDAKSDQIVLFDMVTTVSVNGRVISKSSRKNWPWLPGDMYVPAEAFDFIPALQSQSKLNRDGRYEFPDDMFDITLEMVPSGGAAGRIEPIRFSVSR